VSAATTGTMMDHRFARPRPWPHPEPLRLRIFEWGISLITIALLTLLVFSTQDSAGSEFWTVAVWLPLVVISDLLPVPVWGGVTIAPSLPILLAAAMLFQPATVGILAFVGSTDLREPRRQIGLGHALFNRSQVAASVVIASFAFHSLGGELGTWPEVLLLAMLVLSVDILVNASLVLLARQLAMGAPIGEEIIGLLGGQPVPFVLSYVCFGLAAVLLAVVYEVAGNWALLAFIIPVLLARQVFVENSRLLEMHEAIVEKSRALLNVSQKIADERREERLAVAAGLHDEVLPPLYKVHLMGQVLRQELATGRLLDMEDDLPELVGATEQANSATQGLIRDLRHSRLGPDGLVGTIRSLVRDAEATFPGQIHLKVEDVGGSPIVQLLAYQILREALRNAMRHAHANLIHVSISRDGSDMRLMVEDDGQGFDPKSVDTERHFGLLLIKERVELAGGVLDVQSHIGVGTRIAARLPSKTASEAN
jgi:signal transduction histidine kinase